MASTVEKFMQHALKLATEGMLQKKGGPFGAVIVRNGEIVGEGQNQVTSSNDPTAHAEIQAIRNACKNLKTFILNDCEIYSSCEPCPMCLSAIYWARIDKIYFAANRHDAAKIGFDDAYFHAQVSKPLHEQAIKHQQLMRDEVLKIFSDWEKMEDKTIY